jgi:DnaK suppressor protein
VRVREVREAGQVGAMALATSLDETEPVEHHHRAAPPWAVDAGAGAAQDIAMEAHLTPAQLAELRGALEAKRDALRRALRRHGRPIAEDEEKPIEEVDLAERDIEASDALAVGEHEHHLLDAVEAALAAMDAGTYGLSAVSGEPIPLARLKAVPWARTKADE